MEAIVADRTDEVCRRSGCAQPTSDRRVTLLSPKGERTGTCGPYCDEDTDTLLGLLTHRYASGKPALVVETPENVEVRCPGRPGEDGLCVLCGRDEDAHATPQNADQKGTP